MSSNKMIHHNLDDTTIQLAMVMVVSDMCRPTVGVMSRLMRAVRRCIPQADVLLDVQAGQTLSEAKVACGCRQSVR